MERLQRIVLGILSRADLPRLRMAEDPSVPRPFSPPRGELAVSVAQLQLPTQRASERAAVQLQRAVLWRVRPLVP